MMFKKPTFTRQKSKTRAARKEYKVAREQYLKVHPWCEVGVKCTRMLPDPWGELREYPGRASEVHHVQGRGENYLNEGSWLAVCSECHAEIHAHPSWAYENGFMERRNE